MAKSSAGAAREALTEKMRPSGRLDGATRTMGEASDKVLTTLMDQARRNPVPIALIGAGIAWLALSRGRRRPLPDRPGAGYYETYEGYDERLELGARLRAKAAAARARVAEALGRPAGRHRETLDAEPLILGVIGLALGVAIGVSLPATRPGDRHVGPSRDKPAGRRKKAGNPPREARAAAERTQEKRRRRNGSASRPPH